MANGNGLSFELLRRQTDSSEALLHWFATPLLYRLTIDPRERDEGISCCEIDVYHIQRPGTDAEQQRHLNFDWSGWIEMGIKHPQICSCIDQEEITQKASIGMMALLIAKLERLAVFNALPKGTAADYEVGSSSQGRHFRVEVSGIRVARFPSDSKGRLDEKRERLLKRNPCGFVSVTTFFHPQNDGLHSYLHFVIHPSVPEEVIQEAMVVTNPPQSPEREASILSMEGETALYGADTALAREKHAKAGKILRRHSNGAIESAECHLRRFLAATQYYKAGLYKRAMKIVRRIESRFLPEHDKHLFQTFRNQVRERAKPGYDLNIRKRVEYYQKKDEFKQVAALVWHHPFVFDRSTLAFIRAYTSIRSKHYSAAGIFAAAVCQFGMNNPLKIIEMAFLPCVIEFNEGLKEGWLAARDFAKFFPHPAAYLVTSSILYRLANSTNGESRREWARKQIEYYSKANINYNSLNIEYQNDDDVRFFLFTSAATAAIAYSWLGDFTNASISLAVAEGMSYESRRHRGLMDGIRDFVNSSRDKDLIDADPPAIPSEIKKIITEMIDRTKRDMENQVEVKLTP